MAETAANQTPSLSEDYLLKEKEEKSDVSSKPVEVKEVETPVSPVPEEVVAEKAEETPAAAVTEVTPAATEEVTETTPAATEEVTETTPAATDKSSEDTPAAAEGSTETIEEGNSDEQETTEEKPEIKLETAPADYRFPTTNQTRHCFTRYVEYHRCVAAKGEDAEECNKFAKYYRSLCPDEWIERWNEQRANGTFPGPL